MDYEKHAFLNTLGKRIALLRKAKGFSQSQLAIECDKDRQSINRLEKGNINPSAFYLLQIANALDIHPRELFDF